MEVQGLDINEINEAAMKIHLFHLGSTAIIITIATNRACLKKITVAIEEVRLGFIQG